MNVYLLIHEAHDYDSGEFEMRGVYGERHDAELALVTRTPAGEPSKAWNAHNEFCCSVVEHEVWHAPHLDIRENDPPMQPGEPLISDSLARTLIEYHTAESPFAKLVRGSRRDQPIGTITDIKEEADGLTVTVELNEETDAT